MLLVFFIFIASHSNIAEAADYYLGVYEDGREAYLMEESIEIFQIYTRNGTPEGHEYQCTVKALNPAKTDDFEYVFYSVYYTQLPTLKRGDKHYNKREMMNLPEVDQNVMNYIVELHISKYGKNAL